MGIAVNDHPCPPTPLRAGGWGSGAARSDVYRDSIKSPNAQEKVGGSTKPPKDARGQVWQRRRQSHKPEGAAKEPPSDLGSEKPHSNLIPHSLIPISS